MHISARKLLTVSPDSLWKTINGSNIPVMFDDGELYMTAADIILSRYAWELHIRYPDMTLSNRHTTCTFYNKETEKHASTALGDDFFTRMLELIIFDFMEKFPLSVETREAYCKLAKDAMYINNNLYNAIIENCDIYMSSISSLDLIDITLSPELLSIKADLIESLKDIPEEDVSERMPLVTFANDRALQVLKSDLILSDGKTSEISWHARRNHIKPNSTLQSVFLRGYVPEIDGKMVPHLILANLTEGMRTITDYMVLSRETSKSAATSVSDLQNITVDGRSITYTGMSITYVEPTDCGSTEYFKYKITDEVWKPFIGTWFTEDPSVPIRQFKPSDRKYIGKTLYFRDIHYCKLHSEEKVCQVCGGGITDTMPLNLALGPLLAKAAAEINAQFSMSFKHHISTTTADSDEKDSGTILMSDRSGFSINPEYVGKKVKMVLSEHSTFNLHTILTADSANSITIDKVGKVRMVKLYVTEANGTVTEEEVVLAPSGKVVDFNIDFLRYIRQSDQRGKPVVVLPESGNRVTIDLSGYGSEHIFKRVSTISTPREHVDRFMEIVTNRIPNPRNAKAKIPRLSDSDYNGMLKDVIEIMSLHGDTSMLVCSVILGSMFSNKEHGYKQRGKESVHMLINAALIKRSLSTWAIHREGCKYLFHASCYLDSKRGNSLLDVVLMPNEVIANEARKRKH